MTKKWNVASKLIHYEVGKKIWKAIQEIGGTMTEELHTQEKNKKELEKKLKYKLSIKNKS